MIITAAHTKVITAAVIPLQKSRNDATNAATPTNTKGLAKISSLK
jgi:hypothetical protein